MTTLTDIIGKRDRAVDAAEGGAGAAWMDQAMDAIRELARERDAFTTDEVWERIPRPEEPRAMGAAILKAKREGVIKASGEYRRSMRPACNGRPVMVWISKLRGRRDD